MAATFDKETLIKHRFWILSGCFLLLVLIPLLLLGSSVSATVSNKEEEFHKQETDLNGVKNPKNQVWVDELNKVDKIVDKKKTQVWDMAWQQQSIVGTFPAELEPRFAGKRFGDPIEAVDAEKFKDYYNNQLPELYDLVQPLDGRHGIVQFAGGTGFQAWNSVVQLYREFKKGTPASKDDIWLAQEDLWVKRELLRVIRDANDAVAIFKEVVDAPAAAPAKKDAKPTTSAEAEKKETKAGAAPEPAKKETKPALTPAPFKTKPGIPAHKRFQNPFWEIDLTLERNAKGKHVIKGKITNISKRRQALGVAFKVLLQDREDHPQPAFQPVQVNRDPLAAGESATLEEVVLKENLAIDGLYGVEQVLTWRTAPVKRLDRVELYWNSSHTGNLSLKPPKWLAKSPEGGDATKDANPVNQGGGDTGGFNNPQQRMGKGSFMNLGGGGQSGDGATTKNGLAINRYTDFTDQVRHMPVGLVVVADEDLIPYLLGAFANSRLRIQTTQCHWTHFRHKIAPSFEEEPGQGPTKTSGGKRADGLPGKFGTVGPMAGGSGYGGPSQDMMKKMMQPGASTADMMKKAQGGARGGMTPPASGGPGLGLMGPVQGPSKGTEEDEEDMNLVEVAVYGLASLYERYPPKPPATNEPTSEANK